MFIVSAKHRRQMVILLCCTGAYLCFHAIREELSNGLFKSSFPSFLVPFVFFTITDLLGLRCRSTVWLFIFQGLTVVFLAFFYEFITPYFIPWSVGDWNDVWATIFGYLVYFCVKNLKHR
jgi:hypothetical protein